MTATDEAPPVELDGTEGGPWAVSWYGGDGRTQLRVVDTYQQATLGITPPADATNLRIRRVIACTTLSETILGVVVQP